MTDLLKLKPATEFEKGLAKGFEEGLVQGFNDGLAEGSGPSGDYEAGHAAGYEAGHAAGKFESFDDGMNAMSEGSVFWHCKFLATNGFLDAAKHLCNKEFPNIDTESSLWLAILCDKVGYFERDVMIDPIGWYKDNCYNKK